MNGYSNYEKVYGSGEYEEAYEDASAYDDSEVAYDDEYSYAHGCGTMEDAYTGYEGVYNSKCM